MFARFYIKAYAVGLFLSPVKVLGKETEEKEGEKLVLRQVSIIRKQQGTGLI